jgi:hypothetical protein
MDRTFDTHVCDHEHMQDLKLKAEGMLSQGVSIYSYLPMSI